MPSEDVGDSPLDLVYWAKEVGKGEDMCLKQCIDFIMCERGWEYDRESKSAHEIVLVTDTNLVVTHVKKPNGTESFDVWGVTNDYIELYCKFKTLDAAKENMLLEAGVQKN